MDLTLQSSFIVCSLFLFVCFFIVLRFLYKELTRVQSFQDFLNQSLREYLRKEIDFEKRLNDFQKELEEISSNLYQQQSYLDKEGLLFDQLSTKVSDLEDKFAKFKADNNKEWLKSLENQTETSIFQDVISDIDAGLDDTLN